MKIIENKSRHWGENLHYIYSYQRVPGKVGAQHLVFTDDQIQDALRRAADHPEDLPQVRPMSSIEGFLASVGGGVLGGVIGVFCAEVIRRAVLVMW